MLNSIMKHVLHCLLLFSIVVMFMLYSGSKDDSTFDSFDPWVSYGVLGTWILYLLRLPIILALPQTLFNLFGLVLYNAFPDQVILNGSPLYCPPICVRVVTRGDYPNLVRRNVLRNLNTCLETGLEKFHIEVITDRPIGLGRDRWIREIIVPPRYHTKTGALFKARALQYCLEDEVNVLHDEHWVVHLDEETLLTKDSVRGIINFVLDGKHPFGQGMITYANEPIVNWLTTLADSYRVSDDMGKLRLQFKLFHRPLFGWKGSYVVTQLVAEKDVSFDHGPEGSVAEDCYFAMRAFARGYTFNFIEGEMHEKSPFTLQDLLRQRKRWLQGILLVVCSSAIPLYNKFLLGINLCSWITLPLSSLNLVLATIYPIPSSKLLDMVCAFITSVTIYMYLFGMIKSFSLLRFKLRYFLLCAVGVICTIPVNFVIENIAVIWGLLGEKRTFYVVQKDIPTLITV
ncbi:beta-1,4-mannosyltransferase egh-like [Anopheles ziemanni]|uniref:beta-1,4-mannosyltransferase egh-like n=1 Tax=Anopheles coustani TaxID=139045 RepID=UPI0026580DFD|nr:beta-1,4-mannosyltransferase egh-like [Anopheles coustani]XP_058166675.1 beta-1,4-mannosyltransferase egh-like [Anopheles ziemanni]